MGQDDHRLKSLADDELLAGLASIVGRRNQITAEFLAYLAELDERQIFLDLGFASLFEYCVEALGLCESTAGRHIAAARVCRNHPQVFGMVAKGELHASALSLLRKHVTPENAAELFELCAHRSARKVEELLAARFPRPDVRDLVRRLPARAALAVDVARVLRWPAEAGRALNVECGSTMMPAEAGPALNVECGSTMMPAEAATALNVACGSMMPTEMPPHAATVEPQRAFLEPRSGGPNAQFAAAGTQKSRQLEPLSAGRYGVHFTADVEFRELLERVRGLAGHRLPNGDLMTLLKRGLEAYERELTKEHFGLGRKPRRSRGVAAAPSAPPAPSASKVRVPEASTPEPSKVRVPEASTPEPFKLDTQPTPNRKPNLKRHCPVAVARAVFLRDGRQCSYVSPDGRRCTAMRCLELDHVNPWAAGGESTIDNLRLRCRAHNQRYARQYYGKSRVEAAVRRARRQRAAAVRSGDS